MAIAKRVFLFLIVNILVVTCISVILSLLGVRPYLTQSGLDLYQLAAFCLVWGMGGAFISLLMSRIMAKWLMGVQIIDRNTAPPELREVVDMVYRLADKAGLPSYPQVGIFNSPEANAFATGPSRNRALVAVSTGLLQRMPKNQVEAVIGHEISHVANGDMVTMTLLQGVINAFVMFLARVIAFAVSRALSRRDDESSIEGSPFVFYMVTFVLEIVFMILGSLVVAAFSRYREFRADAGGARLSGKENMIGALLTLEKTHAIRDPSKDQPAFQAFKISSNDGWMRLFASHPPIPERVRALETARN